MLWQARKILKKIIPVCQKNNIQIKMFELIIFFCCKSVVLKKTFKSVSFEIRREIEKDGDEKVFELAPGERQAILKSLIP